MVNMSIEQLIAGSRDERLHRLPRYARELIFQLARRLDMEHRYATSVKGRAEEEVAEARALLAQGPEDSDTFVGLPRSTVTGYSDEPEQRPLGKGVGVEFRRPGGDVGEGFSVRLEDSKLHISSDSYLMVLPEGPTTIVIDVQ